MNVWSIHPHVAPILALAALVLTSPTGTAFANCESGAYMIHTVAEYAELGESDPSFLRIESADSDGFRVVQVATAAPSRLEELHRAFDEPGASPGITLVSQDQTCHPASARFEDDEIGHPGLRIEGCSDFVQPNGYAVYDPRRREVQIPRPLPVQRGVTLRDAVAVRIDAMMPPRRRCGESSLRPGSS